MYVADADDICLRGDARSYYLHVPNIFVTTSSGNNGIVGCAILLFEIILVHETY